jgi:hypothetical protein
MVRVNSKCARPAGLAPWALLPSSTGMITSRMGGAFACENAFAIADWLLALNYGSSGKIDHGTAMDASPITSIAAIVAMAAMRPRVLPRSLSSGVGSGGGLSIRVLDIER